MTAKNTQHWFLNMVLRTVVDTTAKTKRQTCQHMATFHTRQKCFLSILLQLKKTLIFRVLRRIAEVNAKLWLLSLSMVLIEGHARRQSRPVARQWRLKHRQGNWWWGWLGQCRPRQVDNLNWCRRRRKTSESVRNTKQHGWLHGVLRWRGVRAILLLRGNNRYCCGDCWPGIRDLWHDGVLSFLCSE